MSSSLDSQPTEAVSKVIEWLQDIGYKATAIPDGPGVISGTNGLKFLVFTYENSIQFYMGMDLEDNSVTVEECNRINTEWRFLKVTINDKSLSVEMDVPIDFSSESAKNAFRGALGIWDSGLGRVKYWLLELSERGSPSI
jgi:hypothetical protein